MRAFDVPVSMDPSFGAHVPEALSRTITPLVVTSIFASLWSGNGGFVGLDGSPLDESMEHIEVQNELIYTLLGVDEDTESSEDVSWAEVSLKPAALQTQQPESDNDTEIDADLSDDDDDGSQASDDSQPPALRERPHDSEDDSDSEDELSEDEESQGPPPLI